MFQGVWSVSGRKINFPIVRIIMSIRSFLAIAIVLVFLFAPFYSFAEETLTYTELMQLERAELIPMAVEQIKLLYPAFTNGLFPEVLVQKNSEEISVTFYHHSVFATGHEGEIFQVTAFLVIGSVFNSRISCPFGANEDWPFNDSLEIDYSQIDYYIPDQRELEIVENVHSFLNIDKTDLSPQIRIYIFENFSSYGTVVTDGYWTGFSLFDKITGRKRDMGYFDMICAPPEDPWEDFD